MREERHRRIVRWVADQVMPHEGKVRAWLARSRMSDEDIDDVIQETYCRLWSVDDPDSIDRPDAYFFSVARNLLTQQMRRQRIVRIDLIAELDSIAPADESPSPERRALARLDLVRVRALVAALPDRCRAIFEMRKIEGVPQREIARRLGVTESMVENDAAKGLRLLLAALREGESDAAARLESGTASGASA